jgi:hypothetical protein
MSMGSETRERICSCPSEGCRGVHLGGRRLKVRQAENNLVSSAFNPRSAIAKII